jgi:hypothetical protein
MVGGRPPGCSIEFFQESSRTAPFFVLGFGSLRVAQRVCCEPSCVSDPFLSKTHMPKKAAATAPAAAAAAAVAAPVVAAPAQPTEMDTAAPQVKKIVFEQPAVLSTVVDKNDDMEYDLGNLCSFDANPLSFKLVSCVFSSTVFSLFSSALHTHVSHCLPSDLFPCFSFTSLSPRSNMQYLTDLNRDNAQLLINRLYALPTEVHPTVAHHVITLLPKTNTALPREKPVRLRQGEGSFGWCAMRNLTSLSDCVDKNVWFFPVCVCVKLFPRCLSVLLTLFWCHS